MLRRNRKRPRVPPSFANSDTAFRRSRLSSHSATIIELGIIMLKGKSALVTGSTSGIGLAIARAFAKQGANVTINGFGDKDAIEKERSGIEKEFGVKAIYSPADMTKPAEIADMVKTSRIDIRLARYPGQQCRHPARRADRGISDREMGSDHRHQSCRRRSTPSAPRCPA